MKNLSSFVGTDNHPGQKDIVAFLDFIGDFAIGVGAVKAQHVVVDIHCRGNGLMRRLGKTGATVIPIDRCSPMRQTTQRGSIAKIMQHGLACSGHKQTGKASSRYNLPLEPYSSDIVFADFVLGYPADPVSALAEIRRILKPSGRVVIIEIEKFYHTGFKQPADEQSWTGIYPGDIRQSLKISGFSNIIVSPLLDRHADRDPDFRGISKPAGYLMATATT